MIIHQLKEIVGPAQVLTSDADKAPYCTDWRGRYHGKALAVVRPATVEEVSEVVACCVKQGIAIVPQGGNTGLCGGATPADDGNAIVLSLGRLNRIRHIDPQNQTITVEAGCTLAAVQDAARQHNHLFPLSLASEGSCQIGGNLSTNAGGVQVLRYGNMRELTLGLEVVLADGQRLDTLRGLRKDNTGLDLKQCFIGAEGTLGIITAATLKLFPLPKVQATAMAALPSIDAAIRLLNATQAAFGDRLTAFELISDVCMTLVRQHIPQARLPFDAPAPWYVLMELSETRADSALDEMLVHHLTAQHALVDAVVAHNEQQRLVLWLLREEISEAQKQDGLSIKHDISLPISAIPAFVEEMTEELRYFEPALRLQVFGHLGDGNLHFNVGKSPDASLDLLALEPQINSLVYQRVQLNMGSISAEHGIGQLKRNTLPLYADPVKLHAMQLIKNALDPDNLMNPGKVYADRW
ncbi:FAD-binding oxidoreductase [Leeia oryzae]|uniref:FAD-binding oxidoreductase n=1 Tax=Leeia oryzae TaxID=356662 RepID=UPI000380DD2D|nr:FAD-binding oxidoreductase [Leeia oryzae]